MPRKDGVMSKTEQSNLSSLFGHLSKIPLPRESAGACRYARTCGNYNVILGDGVCVKCWDRGLDKKAKG